MSNRRTELNGTLDLGSSGASSHHFIGHALYVATQLVLDNTADAYGTISIQTGNNEENWSTVSFQDETGAIQDGYNVTPGNDVNLIMDAELATGWIRVNYARTSGDGTLNYYLSTKK